MASAERSGGARRALPKREAQTRPPAALREEMIPSLMKPSTGRVKEKGPVQGAADEAQAAGDLGQIDATEGKPTHARPRPLASRRMERPRRPLRNRRGPSREAKWGP